MFLDVYVNNFKRNCIKSFLFKWETLKLAAHFLFFIILKLIKVIFFFSLSCVYIYIYDLVGKTGSCDESWIIHDFGYKNDVSFSNHHTYGSMQVKGQQ